MTTPPVHIARHGLRVCSFFFPCLFFFREDTKEQKICIVLWCCIAPEGWQSAGGLKVMDWKIDLLPVVKARCGCWASGGVGPKSAETKAETESKVIRWCSG